MIKLNIGLIENSEYSLLVMKFTSMCEFLRNRLNYYSNNNHFDIRSIDSPFLSINSNILYIPGENKSKDNNYIFSKINKKHIEHINVLGFDHSFLYKKIINSIDDYNRDLNNHELSRYYFHYNKEWDIAQAIIDIDSFIVLDDYYHYRNIGI